MERRCAVNLSLKEFIKEFALTRTPVVITGLIDYMTVKPWTLDYIKDVCLHSHMSVVKSLLSMAFVNIVMASY